MQRQQRYSFRSNIVCAAAAVESSPAGAAAMPKLSDLPLQAIINPQGFVSPEIVPGSAAAVFSVYDEGQKLQYIGFSKELRGSLRTLLGRRPDKAFYFKAVQLPVLDQEHMLALRQAWFDECGAPPPGNKLALERKAWQSAVDAGAISARAKPAAAAEKAAALQAALKARGCKEEFVPDPELMADGQVDFLQQGDAGAQQAAAAASEAASAAASSGRPVRTATAVVDGQAKQFVVEYKAKYPTKGGCFMDVKLSFDHMDTKHRIIIGKAYYEPYGLLPEQAVEAALALLLHLKMPRHRDGMLGTADFPVNYFTIGEVEQWFPEDFAATWLAVTGKEMTDGQDFFWRMNKIHDYGGKLEDPTTLGGAMTGAGLGGYGG
ncbi:hypothetical protein OEZ86_007875 [Tetradesmus obliquus]|uniref:GIY-YIG domain-containing protein n=1 Tax=Tetradesmus obliquus TaxID=3088 RepID=A0ABY8U7G9_TETOB|nr:hypothetical protein OEZ85_013080 [Tetradesmus obliquus]WIA36585.1 hypothetical protein OEZ86_007875 [Tetradesmus obliquus]